MSFDESCDPLDEVMVFAAKMKDQNAALTARVEELEKILLRSDDVVFAGLDRRIDELEAALAWYGKQARLCRLIHSAGDAGRNALADDGGRRADEVLK